MQVVILCGGLGTRLSEETDTIPKPMVLINEKPIATKPIHVNVICRYQHSNVNFLLKTKDSSSITKRKKEVWVVYLVSF